MNTSSEFVSKDLYDQFISKFPIVCTDAVILNEDSSMTLQFLRTEEPLMGRYWGVGSRLFREVDSCKDNMMQCIKRELNIDELQVILCRYISTIDARFAVNNIDSDKVVQMMMYIVVLPSDIIKSIEMGSDHSDCQWMAIDDSRIHPVQKEIIDKYMSKNRYRYFNIVDDTGRFKYTT